MADKEPQPKPQVYLESGNLEAHIIADMLRIELNKLENWIIGIVVITVTTLLSVLSAIAINALSI